MVKLPRFIPDHVFLSYRLRFKAVPGSVGAFVFFKFQHFILPVCITEGFPRLAGCDWKYQYHQGQTKADGNNSSISHYDIIVEESIGANLTNK